MRESFYDALSVECLMFQVAALNPCRLARFVLRDEQTNDARKTDSGRQAQERSERIEEFLFFPSFVSIVVVFCRQRFHWLPKVTYLCCIRQCAVLR